MSYLANRPVSAIPDPHGRVSPTTGMTMRMHYAGLAMQACIIGFDRIDDAEHIAANAVAYADALLKELEN